MSAILTAKSAGGLTSHGAILPIWHKIAYGCGGLSDFLCLNLLAVLAYPVLTLAERVRFDPLWLGIALAIPKVIGAIMDPLVGNWSDNVCSRWGRRTPFIFVGGILAAILLPLVWLVPYVTQGWRFAYLAIVISVYSLAYSLFSVPYNALGYELTTDYDERTSVLAWRGYVQVIGTFAAAWFYWFCMRRTIFRDEVEGALWLCVLGATVIVIGVFLTVRFARERKVTELTTQTPVPLGKALAMTIRNRPFLLLQTAIMIMTLGLGVTSFLGTYVQISLVCQGDKDFSSQISGLGGTFTIITAFAAMPLGMWLSRRFGKKAAALVGIGIVWFGVLLLPIVLVPAHPWWVIINWVIASLGMGCATLMFGSMTADICDEDELVTGRRREGMYTAAASLFGKVRDVVMLVVAGWLPSLAGYSDTTRPLTVDVLTNMWQYLIAIQLACVSIALLLLFYYPITRARSLNTRRILDERRLGPAANPPECSHPSTWGTP